MNAQTRFMSILFKGFGYTKICMDFLKYSTMSEKYVFNTMILFIGTLFFSGLSSDCSRRPTGFVIICWSRTKLSRSLAFGAWQSRSGHATWKKKTAEISRSLTWSPYKKTNESTESTQRWLHVYMLLMVNCAWKPNGKWFQWRPFEICIICSSAFSSSTWSPKARTQ